MKKTIFFSVLISIIFCMIGIKIFDRPVEEMITGGLNKRIATAVATTSMIYLEPTDSSLTDDYVASTELKFASNGMNGFDMNLIQTASTSAQLEWVYWFSDDNETWYPEEGITDTNDIVMTHGATKYEHQWATGLTTVEYKNTHYPSTAGDILRANYTKVIFTTNTASTSLYAEILK